MIETRFRKSGDPRCGEKAFHGPYLVLASPFVGFVAGTSTLLISNCTPLMSVT
jgi:hypothetical protein